MTEMPDRYWILNPIEHRKADSVAKKQWLEGLSDEERVHVIDVPAPPDDLWICDMCNADMPVVDPYGIPMMCWMEGSYALCGGCAELHLKEHGYPNAACACDGCQVNPLFPGGRR